MRCKRIVLIVNWLELFVQEVSKVSWFFLRHGGSISCEITGRKRSAVIHTDYYDQSAVHSTSGSRGMYRVPLSIHL